MHRMPKPPLRFGFSTCDGDVGLTQRGDKIKTCFIFAIVFLAFLSNAFPVLASDEMEKHRLDLMSSEIISNFQKKEFHQISDKFYFPEHYSDKVILK